MDLRRLRTFVTVAERGSVSKAALTLHITQPALSRQISGLEEELGFALFERAGRRLLLTARGEQLLGDCRSLLTHAAVLERRAGALRRGDIQTLENCRLGDDHRRRCFRPSSARYAKRHPDVKLAPLEADAAPAPRHARARGGASGDQYRQHDAGRRAALCDASCCRSSRCWQPARRRSLHRARRRRSTSAASRATPCWRRMPAFRTRNIFDAACRLAGVRPNVLAGKHGGARICWRLPRQVTGWRSFPRSCGLIAAGRCRSCG